MAGGGPCVRAVNEAALAGCPGAAAASVYPAIQQGRSRCPVRLRDYRVKCGSPDSAADGLPAFPLRGSARVGNAPQRRVASKQMWWRRRMCMGGLASSSGPAESGPLPGFPTLTLDAGRGLPFVRG